FVLLVVVNSLGLIPEAVNEGMSTLSRWCLVTAIAALGIKTSFQKLAVVGWKPVILMALETLLLLAVVLGVVMLGGLGT
ncbi:putative sulfate exporter family transporter, partial [Halomonas nitroreducens]